jgi:hypothetical protein
MACASQRNELRTALYTAVPCANPCPVLPCPTLATVKISARPHPVHCSLFQDALRCALSVLRNALRHALSNAPPYTAQCHALRTIVLCALSCPAHRPACDPAASQPARVRSSQRDNQRAGDPANQPARDPASQAGRQPASHPVGRHAGRHADMRRLEDNHTGGSQAGRWQAGGEIKLGRQAARQAGGRESGRQAGRGQAGS